MDAFEESGPEFRRNLMIVFAVHVALLSGLWLLGGRAKSPPPEQITWLDGGGLGVAAPPEEPAAPLVPPPVEPTPPEDPVAPPPPPEEKTEPAVEKEITPPADPIPEVKPEVPAPTPAPTPKPALAKTTPKPAPKTTPKPTVTKRSTPKPEPTPKRVVEKSTEKPRPASPSKQAENSETPNGGTGNSGKPGGATAEGNGGKGAPGGTPNGAEVLSYFSEVGETFRPIWKQYKPVTVVGTGDELVARVRVRIDSSGRVESARLVRSTGNQEVDASVEKAIPEFRSVPPPPTALLKDRYFEANMDVILRL